MTKENIMEALTACAFSFGCEACPYNGIKDCKEALCNDAVKQLKESENPKASDSKYTRIEIYTKKGNLLEYYANNPNICIRSGEENMRLREYYGKEREIQLIALYRFEKGKCFCKIKCPLNPIPVKGEFETPSMSAMSRFLYANGWTYKQAFNPSLFK